MRVIGAQIDEEVVHIAEDFRTASVAPVNLVDENDDGPAQRERFAENEPGLRQWAFRSINEQDNPVHHGQGPLNFAPKVGMAGSVEHVYFDTFPYYGAILCGDGDSAFLFKIHVVHHAFRHFFAFTECARLPEHCVYQCGLAMVNMRDYRDVSYHGVHCVCVFQCNS